MSIFKKIYCTLLSALIITIASNTLFIFPAYSEEESKPIDTNINLTEVETCNLEEMTKRYMGTGDDESLKQHCWYCRIVVTMTNSYLQAVNSALNISQNLGHIIVKLGFSIWLALYILKQVSAISSTSPAKMLQEILIMGFKCAFVNFAISDGISFITTFFLNPIMLTGTEIGQALLTGLAP